MPMATKLGRMLTYFNGLLPTKSDVLWSCGRVWSRDKLESLYLCYQSVYGHETWQDGNLPYLSCPWFYMALYSRGLVRSRDNLK